MDDRSPASSDPSDLLWDADVHQALSSPVRSRIMALLRATDDGLDITALSDELGLHPNTVRTHLAILDQANLVVSQAQPRDRPGRRRHTYRPSEQASHVDRAGGYRFLARMLTGQAAQESAHPARASERTGSAWGRWLVDEPAPGTTVTPSAAIDQIVELLATIGFAPEVDDADPTRPRVLLRRCPFDDLARQHPEVVCSLHLGIMRGALDSLDVRVEVDDLQPFVEPSLCVSHLQVAEDTRPDATEDET